MNDVWCIPAEVEHRSVRTQQFSISFAEPFGVIFIVSLALLLALCYFDSLPGMFWLLAAIGTPLTALLSAVVVSIVIWRFKFSVGPRGIECYDFWCRPLTTTWEEMESVHPIRLLSLKYLRIVTRSRSSAMWLPLFVDDPEALALLIAEHAGATHTVTLAMRTPTADHP